jgi:hypothetical protein
MSTYYRDYVWIGGAPQGIQKISAEAALSYRIAADPYNKRIVIEKYSAGNFDQLVYDSATLDFRHLRPGAHYAWQKTVFRESPGITEAAIRDQNDRLAWLERYYFEGELCRQCVIRAPYGGELSKQLICYTVLGDSFNGVVLLDSNCHPVMFKCYGVAEESGQFTELLDEQWDMLKFPAPQVELALPAGIFAGQEETEHA